MDHQFINCIAALAGLEPWQLAKVKKTIQMIERFNALHDKSALLKAEHASLQAEMQRHLDTIEVDNG